MAAPANTVWGSEANGKGRLGIYLAVSNPKDSNTTTVTAQIWFWSKYSVSDSSNQLYFDWNTNYASTLKGARGITTTNSSSSWSTSNQIKIDEYSTTFTRGTSAKTVYCAARLGVVEYVGTTMSVSASFTVQALTSYSISYHPNGGTGAPSAQAKYYGINATISSTKPVRTGYTFQGWGTTVSDTTVDYNAGGTYTGNAGIVLYAIWKANEYTVTYNANGGSNAPQAQTKTHGTALTLSSTKPTRSNYIFVGWGTSASATTTSYSPGGSYIKESSITLYAIWTPAYQKPRIKNVLIARCIQNGSSYVDDENGDCIHVKFDCEVDQAPLTWTYTWHVVADVYVDDTMTDTINDQTSYTVDQYIDSISIQDSYEIEISVSDGKNTTKITRLVPSNAYEIDFISGGQGVAIGKSADTKNLFDVNYDTLFRKNVDVDGSLAAGATTLSSAKITGTLTMGGEISDRFGTTITNGRAMYLSAGIDPDTTTYHIILTSKNTPNGAFMYIKTEFYNTKSATANRMQLAFPYNKTDGVYYRYYYNSAWSDWIKIINEDDVASYLPLTGGTLTGYLRSSNTVNVLGYFRFNTDWMGFYGNVNDSHNNESRQGWMGFSNTTHFHITNEAGGSNLVNKAWTVSSDARLKKDVEDIPDKFVDLWNELNPKLFRWTDERDSRIQFGLIAQDVKSTFEKHGLNPEDYSFIVPYEVDGSEYFAVSYDNYYLITSAVLKKTVARVDDLRSQVDEIRQLISKLGGT